MIAGLGARVHLSVRPAARERFIALFRDVLESEVRELDFGMEHRLVLVSFQDGSAVSAEFSERAPEEPSTPVTYETSLRGAWIEFRTADVTRMHARLDAAGIPSFSHPSSPHRYFTAPGGQVFRILDLSYQGP